MTLIENKVFDEERALYGSHDVVLRGVSFDGPLDGESALKESSDVEVHDGYCNLRYPFWHVHRLTICDTEMTDKCRAALWYSDNIAIKASKLHGIKALRECANVAIERSSIVSAEFGWNSKNVTLMDTTAESEYFMMNSENIRFDNVGMKGKYSFQYIKNAEFVNCNFDTKDAFWHAENVVVRDSTVKGEYLAWYAKNITFENCKIIGTQPFCYCENLRLINCEMHDCDLAFERSTVNAEITTPIISVKNPYSGKITAPAVGEIIRNIPESAAEIVVG